ncbi:MAG: stage IV sporulation protein A [Eubacteriales bacterium]|nr:stage IV sporulation protein A [Eubacteriales bacterium]
MEGNSIYQDIATRTDGDIYIGVVGPVRTGKSTFIKKFMDKLIPNIENEHKRQRAVDELPQSAQGRTIMTTEPKFVPNEAVEVTMGDNASFRVRMIDCVGYIVPNAMGYIENNAPRMVNTPWFEEEIPFSEAAEIGTKKVISEHSTIGIVITTDGSITELDREDYIAAEERVIKELKEINKPFIVVLNSANPNSEEAQELKKELEQQYRVPVMAANCAQLEISEINEIIQRVLYEFPLSEITINLPSWMASLSDDHYLRKDMLSIIKNSVKNICKIRESKEVIGAIENSENVEKVNVDEIKLGEGSICLTVNPVEGLFYNILSEASGLDIDCDEKLMSMMVEMGTIKKEYDKFAPAIKSVRENGYGIVSPTMEEMTLEEPEIVKQGSRYGVRLRASAPSIHMIRADIETEVSPIVGTERQSEELIHYLLNEFDDDPVKIWQSNIFGKSLNELVNEGLHNKLSRMPDDAQVKLQETLQKIINEGSGGLICIIL